MVPLTHQITPLVVSYSTRNQQSNTTYKKKLGIIDELNAKLAENGSNYLITAKGSTVNGFALESSDLDLIALVDNGLMVSGMGMSILFLSYNIMMHTVCSINVRYKVNMKHVVPIRVQRIKRRSNKSTQVPHQVMPTETI